MKVPFEVVTGTLERADIGIGSIFLNANMFYYKRNGNTENNRYIDKDSIDKAMPWNKPLHGRIATACYSIGLMPLWKAERFQLSSIHCDSSHKNQEPIEEEILNHVNK